MKVAAYLVAGILVGAVAALVLGGGMDPGREPSAGVDTLPLERRLSRLETELELGRSERQGLARRLAEVTAALQARETVPDTEAAADGRRGDLAPAGAVEAPGGPGAADGPPPRGRVFARGGRALDDDERIQRFIEAGIAPDRAQWIIQRESELRMETLQARYDAVRDGVALELRTAPNANDTLRTELGDADYERYLEALGRPTSVGVGSVFASSPAATAGFQAGDRIVSYAGERVFDMNDLNRLTLEGRAGETVAVEVLRDGAPIQLYLPRGPLGISGGARFRGRR